MSNTQVTKHRNSLFFNVLGLRERNINNKPFQACNASKKLNAYIGDIAKGGQFLQLIQAGRQ